MQIELFGCTSAGKSSLAQRMLRCSRGLGIEAALSEDFVLRDARLERFRGVWIRRLLIDLLASAACLRTRGENRDFFRFVAHNIWSLPSGIGWPERLNVARNVVKKIGVREIVRRNAPDRQLVVMDEGTLQTAHYLFVQRSADVDPGRLAQFLRLVPLPDVAVYVRETEATLVRRTMARGHKRIPDRSHDTTAVFMKRALRTLDAVAGDERVRARLIVVDMPGGSVAAATTPAAPETTTTLEIVRAAMPVDRAAEAG